MGRIKARRVERQQRRQQARACCEPTVTVEAVNSREELAAVMERMLPQAPRSADWRADVLGQECLSIGPDWDGWPLMNGHRVTREMCEAVQAERPEQAAEFDYDELAELAELMGPPAFGGPLFGRPW